MGEKIIIGNSDYTRSEMEERNSGWGTSSEEFLFTIKNYESKGYTVRFETSLFRRLFSSCIYKVIAIK